MTRCLGLGSIALASACFSSGSSVDLAKGDEADPIVVTRECRGAPADPLHLATMTVEGDRLRVGVSYGGGCAPHAFAACWDGFILDSSPPLLHLEVHHEANGDSCDAHLSHDILIDVSDLPFDFASATIRHAGGTIELVGR
jgi:hypothetical protein